MGDCALCSVLHTTKVDFQKLTWKEICKLGIWEMHIHVLYILLHKKVWDFMGAPLKSSMLIFSQWLQGGGIIRKHFLLHKYIAYLVVLTYLGKYILGRYLGGHFWCSDM